MPYSIKNTQGNTIVTVADKTIDSTTTSLSLVGYNATGSGLLQMENLVHLMENFSGPTAPPNPIVGQNWFDTIAKTLKVFVDGDWENVSASSSTSGGEATGGGLAGVYHMPINSLATSVLLYLAGGKIVAILSNQDVLVSALPASVTIGGVGYPVATRFTFGLEAGITLAEDANNYVLMGKVALADNALFAGGGDANKPAGWAFIDLGAKSIGVMIADGIAVSVVSPTVIANGDLPATISVKVRKDDRTIETTAVTLKTSFPNGLSAGLTHATNYTTTASVPLNPITPTVTKTAAYTLTAVDSGYVMRVDSASAVAITLPNSLPVGFELTVIQMGSGQVQFVPATGATLNNRNSFTRTAGQYARVTLNVQENSSGVLAKFILAGDATT